MLLKINKSRFFAATQKPKVYANTYRFPGKTLPGEVQLSDSSRHGNFEVQSVEVDLAIADVKKLSC